MMVAAAGGDRVTDGQGDQPPANWSAVLPDFTDSGLALMSLGATSRPDPAVRLASDLVPRLRHHGRAVRCPLFRLLAGEPAVEVLTFSLLLLGRAEVIDRDGPNPSMPRRPCGRGGDPRSCNASPAG
jgi:hypothetical protein